MSDKAKGDINAFTFERFLLRLFKSVVRQEVGFISSLSPILPIRIVGYGIISRRTCVLGYWE